MISQTISLFSSPEEKGYPPLLFASEAEENLKIPIFILRLNIKFNLKKIGCYFKKRRGNKNKLLAKGKHYQNV